MKRMAPGSFRDATAGLLLGRLVEGVGSTGMVGLVDDARDLRDLLAQRRLDPLLEGHVDHAAPLAAAAETQVDEVVLHVEEVDPAAMPGDRRVDHLVQDLLDLLLDVAVVEGIHGETFFSTGQGETTPILAQRQGGMITRIDRAQPRRPQGVPPRVPPLEPRRPRPRMIRATQRQPRPTAAHEPPRAGRHGGREATPMQIEIKYQPSYSLAIVRLEPNERIQAEAGAMVSMSANLEIDTSMKGGMPGALTRTVLGGETLFANTFTSRGGPGEITLAPSLPGDIATLRMSNETLFIQSGSFLAGDPEISLDLKWGGSKAFFGSEGLFLLKASGSGPVLLCSYGAVHKVTMDGRAPYICDTGHVVAFTQGLDYDVRKVGNWKSTLLSGEGLVCEFRGTGDLYLQSRSTQAFLSWLIPRIPGRTGGGGGVASGVLGNILRGD